MTPEERAKEIAVFANTCCDRGDGYEEDVRMFSMEHIRAAVTEERKLCLKVSDCRIDSIESTLRERVLKMIGESSWRWGNSYGMIMKTALDSVLEEREACAKIADRTAEVAADQDPHVGSVDDLCELTAETIAKAIRARGK